MTALFDRNTVLFSPLAEAMRLKVRERYWVARNMLESAPRSYRNLAPFYAARSHERALMIDLLQRFHLKGDLIAGINLTEDLIRDSHNRITTLGIRRTRTRDGSVFNAAIPAEMERNIQEHLTDFRPHLPGSYSHWLFPGRTGGPRASFSIQRTLDRAIEEARLSAKGLTSHDPKNL
jgi:hypothetical protein